jgi:hypothetical protein
VDPVDPDPDPHHWLRESFILGGRAPNFLYKISTAHVRGVLGNKCAGHHNLKTVKIREMM